MFKFQLFIGGIILIIVGVFSASGFKVPNKFSGMIEPSTETTTFYLITGFIFIVIAIFYKAKHSDFSRCKKCHKVYNYTDAKDKNNICPKCGGVLQDYAEFEKEQKNFFTNTSHSHKTKNNERKNNE